MIPISYEEMQQLMDAEDKRHREAINALRLRNKLFQQTCPHNREWNVFVPDPSGNNDSYNECRKCGKQW